MNRIIVLLVATLLSPTLAHAGVGESLLPPPDPTEIYGGQLAGTCQWPSAVAIWGNETACTGSLVHPELIVTAAHCLNHGPLTTAAFGEDAWANAREVAIAECVQHPNYPLEYPDYADFMYCRLAQPVLDVPIVPILMGCETDGLQPGVDAVLAGYGLTESGDDYGTKRWVSTPIDFLEDSRVFFAGGTGIGTCNGDSGGPAFLEVADGTWRVFGTTTGGPDCGDWGQSEMIHVFVPWIEEQTGLDVTPCHHADGTWAPSDGCSGFPAEPDVPQGSWNSMCSDGPVTGPSTTCEVEGGSEESGSTSGDGGSSDGDSGLDESDGDESSSSSDGSVSRGDGGPNVPDPSANPLDPAGESAAGCSCNAGTQSPFLLVLLVAFLRRRTTLARSCAPCRPRAR